MSLSLFPPVAVSTPSRPSRRGRPRVAESPAERAKHIEVAKALLLFGVPAKVLAYRLGVSRRSVFRWTSAALRYEGHDADLLRRLAARRTVAADTA